MQSLSSRVGAAVATLIALLGLLAACGGAESVQGLTDRPVVKLSPGRVALAPGESLALQVDVANLPTGDGVSGYAISLSEQATGIDIRTEPCPPGEGTAACRRLVVRPAVNAEPGLYAFRVRAAGTRVPVEPGVAEIAVMGARIFGRAVLAATGSHVVTADGRLWASGANAYGQTGVGFESVGFDPDAPFVLPDRLDGYNQVGADSDWVSVLSADGSTLALKRDGSVWAWGANPLLCSDQQGNDGENICEINGFHAFGRPSPRDLQLTPVRIDGLPSIAAISALLDGRQPRLASNTVSYSAATRYLALGADGTVWAWGGAIKGLQNSRRSGTALYYSTDQPMVVPQAFAANGSAIPLDGVTAIAGGLQNSGGGWALALRGDGSVWQLGSRDGSFAFDHGRFGLELGTAIPARVSGLPRAAQAVAAGGALAVAGSNDTPHYALAVLDDGTVWAWSEMDSTPQQVLGLAGIVAIDTAYGVAAALDMQGRVWRWNVFGGTPAVSPDLPPMRKLALGAPGLAVASDCNPELGSLWRTDIAQRVQNFGLSDAGIDGCVLREGTVVLAIAKVGEGTVAVDPATTSGPTRCGLDCSVPFTVVAARRERLRVQATPAPGWQLDGFNADCLNGEPLLDRDTRCTATFTSAQSNGGLLLRAKGAGEVFASPAGIRPPNEGVALYPLGAEIQLTARPDAGHSLARWTGETHDDDIDCRDGVVTMNMVGEAVKVCIAEFVADPRLRVPAGPGGRVVSTPVGIDCGAVCDGVFALGALIDLRAEPAAGYRFEGFAEVACRQPFTLRGDIACTPQFDTMTPPATPTDLRASASSQFIQLYWSADPRARRYQLTRWPGSGSEVERVVGFDGPVTSYVDAFGIAPDTSYRYDLVALNDDGASAAAATIVVTPVAAGWTRVGAGDIVLPVAFAQPALALSADGSRVALAQVLVGSGFDQTAVFENTLFSASSWTQLLGSPGETILPPGTGTQPALALDDQEGAVIAWTQGGGADDDVRVARYDVPSRRWVILGGPLDVSLGGPGLNGASQPALAIDGTNHPVVAWLQSGGVYARRWTGSGWENLGDGGSATGSGAAADAFRLALDTAGTPHVLVRRGSGSGAQLFAFRALGGRWEALGPAINNPLAAPRGLLSFFDFVIEADGSPLAVWSEGSAPFAVLARRWRGGVWQPLPNLVANEDRFAITGLAAARSDQQLAFPTAPPVVMVARSPVFVGANPRSAAADVYQLESDTWVERQALVTFGPIFGLSVRVTGFATPVAAWLAETGNAGSGELRVFSWRATN